MPQTAAAPVPDDPVPDAATLLERAAAHARAGRVAPALADTRLALAALDRRAAAPPAAVGEALPDRAHLEAAADRLAASQPGVPQQLLVVGLDRLGRVNEAWSPATGDAVLAACGALLRAQARPQDLLARLDGDRFAIVPAGAVSTTRALLVAERLRRAVQAHEWGALQPGLALTASVGLAARAPGEPLAAALARAEAALARCKRGGRNQVSSAD